MRAIKKHGNHKEICHDKGRIPQFLFRAGRESCALGECPILRKGDQVLIYHRRRGGDGDDSDAGRHAVMDPWGIERLCRSTPREPAWKRLVVLTASGPPQA